VHNAAKRTPSRHKRNASVAKLLPQKKKRGLTTQVVGHKEEEMERAKGFEPKDPSLPAFHKTDVSYHMKTIYRTTPKNAILSEGTKSGQIFQEFSGILHSPSSNSHQSNLVSGHQCSWHPCHQVSPVIPTLNSANHREPVYSKEWWRWTTAQSKDPPMLLCQTRDRIGAPRLLWW